MNNEVESEIPDMTNDIGDAIESECEFAPKDYSWIAEACAVQSLIEERIAPILAEKNAKIAELLAMSSPSKHGTGV